MQETRVRTHLTGPREIDRTQLCTRVREFAPRLVTITAPAGFGKSTFARRLARDYPSSFVCDLHGVGSGAELAMRVVEALAQLEPQRRVLAQARLSLDPSSGDARRWTALAASQWNGLDTAGTLAIFENAEAALDSQDVRDFLGRLLRSSGRGVTVALCSRRPVPMHVGGFAAPHEVFRITARDLAFTRSDVCELFDLQPDAPEAAHLYDSTAGWPVLLLLLRRLARTGTIADVLAGTHAEGSAELYGYLLENFLEAMPAADLDALLLVAVLETGLDDLHAFVEEFPARKEALLELPFVQVDAAGVLRVHPLVLSALMRHYDRRAQDVLRSCAQRLCDAGDFVHSAFAWMRAGDARAAARTLDQVPPFVYTDRFPECAAIASRIDSAILREYPNLWVNTIPFRSFVMPVEEHLSEARAVWLLLEPHTDPSTRIAVLRDFATTLCATGRAAEATALIREELERTADGLQRDVLQLFLALVFALQGRFREAHALRAAVPCSPETDYQRSRLVENCDVVDAVFDGRFDDAFALLDAGIERSRVRQNGPVLAFSFLNAFAYAWFAGDDSRATRYLAGLEDAVLPGMRAGFEYFLSAVHNVPFEGEPSREHPVRQVLAELVRCAQSSDRTQARDYARRACALDDRHVDPLMKICANIALAEFSSPDRESALAAAKRYAAGVDSAKLRAAIDAYAAGGEDLGPLSAFVATRLRHRTVSHEVHVSVLAGSVTHDGAAIRLPKKGLELMLYLGARRGVVQSDELCDTLWPESDADTASDALRVTIYRVRKAFGRQDVVLSGGGGYLLGPHVSVDTDDLDGLLRTVSDGGTQSIDDVLALIRRRKNVRAGWEWFGPVERRLFESLREAAVVLARRALEEDDCASALAIAQALSEHDACDESACELAMRAYMRMGKRDRAQQEFRRYRDQLARELDAEPSALLKRIAGESAG